MRVVLSPWQHKSNLGFNAESQHRWNSSATTSKYPPMVTNYTGQHADIVHYQKDTPWTMALTIRKRIGSAYPGFHRSAATFPLRCSCQNTHILTHGSMQPPYLLWSHRGQMRRVRLGRILWQKRLPLMYSAPLLHGGQQSLTWQASCASLNWRARKQSVHLNHKLTLGQVM